MAPADEMPLDGADHRLHKDIVDELAVAEALQREPPQKPPVLALLEREGENGGRKIHDHEERIVEARELDVRRIVLLAVLHIVGDGPRDLKYQHQVDERRDEAQHDLEQPDLGKGNEAERPVAAI